MTKKISIGICIFVLIATAGCSVFLPGSNNTKAANNSITKDADSSSVTSPNQGQANKTKSGNKGLMRYDNSSNYTSAFRLTLQRFEVPNLSVAENDSTLQIRYTGNFSNRSRTISEIRFISTIYAEVTNQSYYNKDNWEINRLNIVGKSSNGSVIWDFRTEDWWAMNYMRDNWRLSSYVNATLNTGDRWNLTSNQPTSNGSKYRDDMRNNLDKKTSVNVSSVNHHGAEVFLTYQTDRKLNSSRYFDQVANVVDVYKNLTLPRSLNRTDGWYAGVLNIEIRNGNDTLEWYRYRIRWAEERVRGEMTREEEAGRLRLSRFLEKDRLRDTPDADE